MATTIETYFDDEVTLTSRIGSITATTDKARVPAEIIYSPGDEDEMIYSTVLQAYNGKVELDGAGKLIGDHLRAKDKIYGQVGISIDGATKNLTAMCCDYVLPESFDATDRFLTAAPTSVVHMGSRIHLAHYADGNDQYLVQAVGIGKNGERISVSHELTSAPDMDYSVRGILEFAITDQEMQKVAYFAITHGKMQHIYYIAEDPAYMTFVYKNIFNATEYIDVVGTARRKTKADRSLAVCSGRAMHYDRKVTRTYEVQTAALTGDQAREMEQMIISRQVKLHSPSGEWDILIEDHTCETSDDDGELTTMKFTFRLADEHAGEPLDALPPAIRVFSHEFNRTFS